MTPEEGRHWGDDRLIAVYFSMRKGEGQPEPADSAVGHLHGCSECSRRFNRLAASLDRLRADSLAEADAAFTDERLKDQRQRILRRLVADRPARVVPFPGSATGGPGASATPRRAPRWIAAAAGFLLGLTAGRLMDIRPEPSRTIVETDVATGFSLKPQHLPVQIRHASSEPALAREEAFLSDVNEALYRPGIAELRALDVLTPRVREEAGSIR